MAAKLFTLAVAASGAFGQVARWKIGQVNVAMTGKQATIAWHCRRLQFPLESNIVGSLSVEHRLSMRGKELRGWEYYRNTTGILLELSIFIYGVLGCVVWLFSVVDNKASQPMCMMFTKKGCFFRQPLVVNKDSNKENPLVAMISSKLSPALVKPF